MPYHIFKKIKISINLAVWILVVLSVISVFIFSFAFIRPIVWALSGDYNRSDIVLSIDDWNWLDDDFVIKEGDTMTGGLNMDNNRITGLTTLPSDTTSVASVDFVNNSVNATLGGTVYNNWGRDDCGTDTLLYGGYAFGNHYLNSSGGDNDICLSTFLYDSSFDFNNIISDQLWPAHLGYAVNLPTGSQIRLNGLTYIKCAACFRSNSSCYISYGTHDCTVAPFTQKAYDGYSLGGVVQAAHQISRERNCVNQNYDGSGGIPAGLGALWYGSQIIDNFNLNAYTENVFIECAVCCN